MTDYVAEARKLRVSIVQLAQYAPDEVAATAAFAFDPWDAAGCLRSRQSGAVRGCFV